MRHAVPACLVGLSLGLASCSFVLNTSDNGLTCGPNGACLAGYACNAQNLCEPAANVTCNPTCGALETCVRQRCVPSCAGRGCPSGTTCSGGVCSVEPPAPSLTALNKLGGTCTSDADCANGTSPTNKQLFCLIPFGGHSNGFCSADCTTNTDCGAQAPVCQAYTSEAGADGVSICAPASCQTEATCSGTSLLPCITDADCTPSGLVCGVYATGNSNKSASVIACRAPIADGGNEGAKCDPTEAPCANGLCVPASPTAGDFVCTTTCDGGTDCMGIFTDTSGSMGPSCLPVTVGGLVAAENDPHVRASLCVPGTATLGKACDVLTSACGVDAPICVPALPDGGLDCVSYCTDDLTDPSLRCPGGSMCSDLDGGSYCVISME